MTVKKRARGTVKETVKKHFFELIKRLLESGLNWTDISKYLARYHSFKIWPGQLKVCFEKIKAEQESSTGCGKDLSNC